jgi:hypothetical protein
LGSCVSSGRSDRVFVTRARHPFTGRGFVVPALLFLSLSPADGTSATEPQVPSAGLSDDGQPLNPTTGPRLEEPVGEAHGGTGDQDEAAGGVDVSGNEVNAAIAKYKIDATGSLYELHSPQTDLPHLGSPKT